MLPLLWVVAVRKLGLPLRATPVMAHLPQPPAPRIVSARAGAPVSTRAVLCCTALRRAARRGIQTARHLNGAALKRRGIETARHSNGAALKRRGIQTARI